MRIDAYTHFFPKEFFDKLNEIAPTIRTWASGANRSPALTISMSARRSSTATRTISRS